MADGVREIAALPDPVGEVVEERALASGLEMRKVRVPLGVVAVVYEARPNVTVDCAALCIKSGNAIVLRGSSYAERSNGALAALVRDALEEAGLPADAVELLGGDRSELAELAGAEGPGGSDHPARGRGPQGGAQGGREGARDVCGVRELPRVRARGTPTSRWRAGSPTTRRYSARGLQRGRDAASELGVAAELLPDVLGDLADAGVELVGDERVRESSGEVQVGPASEDDWSTEYLGMKMAVGVVDSLDEAIEHVNRYGSGHSEAIVTGSDEAGERFTGEVDAAAVYVNASTRFTDGYEFGMGAEIGNSTQKLHARGPIGLRELTTTKYVVHGTGQVRR